ncbi:MAG: hypothetical protein ACOWWR_02650 [Eubacteriales bacterium]
MLKKTKVLLVMEAILILVFIVVISGVTFNYFTYNKIRYLFYLILILNPLITILLINIKEGKPISDNIRNIIIARSVIIGVVLIVFLFT